MHPLLTRCAVAMLALCAGAPLAAAPLVCAPTAAEMERSLSKFTVTDRLELGEDDGEEREYDPAQFDVAAFVPKRVWAFIESGKVTGVFAWYPVASLPTHLASFKTQVPQSGEVSCDEDECEWVPAKQASLWQLEFAQASIDRADARGAIVECHYRDF